MLNEEIFHNIFKFMNLFVSVSSFNLTIKIYILAYIILEILKDYFYEPMYHYHIVPNDLIGYGMLNTFTRLNRKAKWFCLFIWSPSQHYKVHVELISNLLTLSLAGLDLLSG